MVSGHTAVPKELTPASAPPLGPNGVPRHHFQSCPPIVKKSSAINTEVPAFGQIPRYHPKKRGYLYGTQTSQSEKNAKFRSSYKQTVKKPDAVFYKHKTFPLRDIPFQMPYNK